MFPCPLADRAGASVKLEEVMKWAKNTHWPGPCGDNVVRSFGG